MVATRWQRTLFSPNGLFLAVIQSGEETCEYDDDTEYIDSLIIIYSNGPHDARSDKWYKMAERGPFPQLGGVKNPILFHPMETGLIVIAEEKTYWWQFSQSSQNEQDCHNHSLHELYPRPLHDITFTDSGKYLFGVCEEYDTVRMTMPTNSGNLWRQSDRDVTRNELCINGTSNEYSVLAADAARSLTHAQGPLDISLSWNGDAVESSTLHQHKDDSIFLSNISMDGRE